MRELHIAGVFMMFAVVTSNAIANDVLLNEALSRSAISAKEIDGRIHTTTTIIGGDEPDVETDIVDAAKSPNGAVASYADLKDVIGQDARLVRREDGHPVYAFTTRRMLQSVSGTSSVRLGLHQQGKEQEFSGEAKVRVDAEGRPYVSHIYLSLRKAAGSLFIARIKKIDLSYSFSPIVGKGAMVATSASADVDVRALLFVHRVAHSDSILVMAEGQH